MPFKNDVNKFGFLKNDKPFIEAKFDYALDFNEGMAAVNVGKTWGYLDKSGNQVIPPRFDKALDFSGGLAPVKVGKNWGYIDKSGKMVIPAKFDDALSFTKAD